MYGRLILIIKSQNALGSISFKNDFNLSYVFLGESHLSRALELARKKMFSKDWGVREDKLNIMLLMTDGTESSATAVDHPALDHIKALNQSGLTLKFLTNQV